MDTKDAGRLGGKARAKKLSPERRKEIATQASHARKNYPQKRHTFDCTVPNCKVTIHHEHI